MSVPATLPAHGPSGGALQSYSGPDSGMNAVRETMETLKAIRTFVQQEMKKDLDFGVIPGAGDKKVLLQPGAQKTALYFNACPDHEVQKTELGNGHVEYLITTKLISRSTGAVIGFGLGSCSTMESKYRFRRASRRCPACSAEAIIAGKPEWNHGVEHWICHKKRDGCGAKFAKDNPSIASQAVGTVENDNIHDQRNTVLKMGVKRSFVAAALSLGCLSELFTQDLEETYDPSEASAASGDSQTAPQVQQRGGSPDDRPHDGGRPRTGKALFAWVKEQEQQHQVGLLKYLNGWAKLQDLPVRMVDWTGEQVALGLQEAERKLADIARAGGESAMSRADHSRSEVERQQAEDRRAVNESFRSNDHTGQPRPWASFVAGVVREHNDFLDAEYAMHKVPREDRNISKVVVPQLNHHIAGRAVESGGEAEPEKRTPAWAAAVCTRLFREDPDRLRSQVESYLAGKVQEARDHFGIGERLDGAVRRDHAVANEATQNHAAQGDAWEPGSDG